MGLDAMIFIFWMLSFKPAFSLSSFTFFKRLFSFSSLSAMRVVSSAYLRLLIFLPAILIPTCGSSLLAFHMMYSACKLNKQDDNIQHWCTLFPIWNQSIVPCPILTVAFWPAYRFLCLSSTCPHTAINCEMFPGESLLNVGLMVAQMAKNHLQCRRSGFNPWVRKILWRREWLATPVLLPEEFQGQRSLASYSPWGPKESDTTEWLSFSPRKLLFCKDNILSIFPYFVLVSSVFIQLFFISYGRFIIVIGKRVRLIQATPPVSRTG